MSRGALRMTEGGLLKSSKRVKGRVRPSALLKPAAAFLLLCAVLLSAATAARANMAEPRPAWRAGEVGGEPGGGLKAVHILRETLLIDLRPLRSGRPARVEATYRLRNEGGERAFDLVFVAAALAPQDAAGGWVWRGSRWVREAGDGAAEGGVWLDGQPVPASGIAAGELPKNWAPPSETPALDGRGAEALPYNVEGQGAISFRLTLPPGEHTVRVSYEARPTAYSGVTSNAVDWQLGYVLAPAREWGSFGGLDAKVLVPEGWRVASSPEMTREGDALVASWDALPADALAVTARTGQRTVPDPLVYWKALIVLGALFTLPAGFAGWKVGRRLGERRRTIAWALPVSPLVALLLCLLASLVATLLAAPTAPDQAVFNGVGNYNAVVTFVLILLGLALHSLVSLAGAFVAHRRAK